MNKKNKVIAIISIVFIIVLSFLTYKSIMLHKYSTIKIENYNEIINGLSFDQTMNIYKKTINENDYLIIDDIKIRNDFNTFKKTEKQFLKLALKIINVKDDLDLKLSDVDIKFTRRQHDNLLTKTQALMQMLEAGIKPEIAIATCGLFNDPMDIALQSKEYLDRKWKQENVQGVDKKMYQNKGEEVKKVEGAENNE